MRYTETTLETFVEGLRVVIPREWTVEGEYDNYRKDFILDISRRLAECDKEVEEPVEVQVRYSYSRLKPTVWNYIKFDVLRILRFRFGLTAPFFQPEWVTYYENGYTWTTVKTKHVTKYIIGRHDYHRITLRDVEYDQTIRPCDKPPEF